MQTGRFYLMWRVNGTFSLDDTKQSDAEIDITSAGICDLVSFLLLDYDLIDIFLFACTKGKHFPMQVPRLLVVAPDCKWAVRVLVLCMDDIYQEQFQLCNI